MSVERFRRIAIHQHLAGDHAHAELLRFLEEGVDRLRMHGAIDRRRIVRAWHAGIRGGTPWRPRAWSLSAKLLFGDERVLVEPVDELLAESADDLRLRIVTWQSMKPAMISRVVAVLLDRRAVRQQRAHLARGPEVRDLAAGHRNDGVRLVAHRAVRGHRGNASPVYVRTGAANRRDHPVGSRTRKAEHGDALLARFLRTAPAACGFRRS